MALILKKITLVLKGEDMKKLKEYDSYRANHTQTDSHGVVYSVPYEIEITLEPLSTQPFIPIGMNGHVGNGFYQYKMTHIPRYLPPRGVPEQYLMMHNGYTMSEKIDAGIAWFSGRELELLQGENASGYFLELVNSNMGFMESID